jgi:hypothetical protein
MSEEGVAEVSIVVKMPESLKKALEEMTFLTLKGDKLKLYSVADIAREALLKGMRLMMVERQVFETILESEAKIGAERIYASLVKPIETAQTATGDEGEESVKKRRNKNV